MPASVASSVTTRLSTSSNHHRILSEQKVEIWINVYDLLPPGKLSSLLWVFGCPLLHTGVVLRNKEFAFGGHDRRGITGVYFTKPRQVPPGATFRVSLLQGFTVLPLRELETIVGTVSQEFLGPSYSLLSKNCNHFTSRLVKILTGKSPPKWLNRAASIAVAFPCVIPREWIEVPECDDVGGELVDEEEDACERTRILRGPRLGEEDVESWRNEMDRIGKVRR